jgi:hypothetical protein
MAGTLTISTLSDGTNSTSATNLVRGPCVAWVNFNGTGTVAIRASYNVSSITDNGTGDYTVNFTNALADVNYSFNSTMGMADSADPSTVAIGLRCSPYPGTGSATYTMTTTQLRLQAKYANPVASGVSDSEVVCVSVFR